MNIYISAPRRGRTDTFTERICKIIGVLQGQYYPTRSSDESLERLDLGLSITRLLMCDGAHFTQCWENDKACRIEHEICKVYGIKIWKD